LQKKGNFDTVSPAAAGRKKKKQGGSLSSRPPSGGRGENSNTAKRNERWLGVSEAPTPAIAGTMREKRIFGWAVRRKKVHSQKEAPNVATRWCSDQKEGGDSWRALSIVPTPWKRTHQEKRRSAVATLRLQLLRRKENPRGGEAHPSSRQLSISLQKRKRRGAVR